MIITGNLQVSRDHMTLGRDVIIPKVFDEPSLHPYKKWASIIRGEGTSHYDPQTPTLAITQLNHTGRQSPNFLGGRWPFEPPLAPSAVPMDLKRSRASKPSLLAQVTRAIGFQTPREMSLRDINRVADEFVRGAELAAKAGFDGVQIHAAHGCEYICTDDRPIRTVTMRHRSNDSVHVAESLFFPIVY